MLKLRQYFLFLVIAAAILTGCSKKTADAPQQNEEKKPSFYSPFKLF